MNAYRDELDAARQRNEQLEGELAEARREVKRLRKLERPAKPEKPRKTRRQSRGGDISRRDILFYGGIGLGGAAALYVLCVFILPGSSVGSLSSRGGELGDWTLEITRCHSGQDFSPSFDGVELSGRDPDAVLRVAMQSDELWIMVRAPRSPETAPGERREFVRVDEQSCETRDVVMERSSFSGKAREGEETIWNVDGHVRLDCATPGGGHLIVTAEFDACTF